MQKENCRVSPSCIKVFHGTAGIVIVLVENQPDGGQFFLEVVTFSAKLIQLIHQIRNQIICRQRDGLTILTEEEIVIRLVVKKDLKKASGCVDILRVIL